MNKKGLVFVLSGPSGSGKGTVLEEVLKTEKLYLSVSATSRRPREGEKDGVNYYFYTPERFSEIAAGGGFLEYTTTYGNFYGTPRQPILDAVERGDNIMLEIDSVGAVNVKAEYPDAILIFLVTPNVAELKRRLIGRGTEDPEQLKTRIDCYIDEIKAGLKYDYLVINDDVKRCAADVITIIRAEQLKIKNNIGFINNFKGDNIC